MKIESLHDLFVEQLRDMHYAESKTESFLPRMAASATDPQLRKAFETHLRETGDQLKKIERVMAMLGLKARGEKCEAIDGILKETENLISHAKNDLVLDAVLIAAAQKVEHYEIATYGTLCAFANRLGYKEEAKLLHEILEQEKKTDLALTRLAEQDPVVNARATAA